MAEVPLDQAVPRFTANENRLDIFVNNATGYTTSGGVDVQSIQEFLASIGSNGIDFVDNAKARFGTGNDLEIYHDGSNSIIDDSGTGNLYIRSNDVLIDKYTGERMIRAIADGAVTLYYDNSEKLATTSSGIDVTGKAGINVASPSAYLHIKDDTAANDDYDVQIESFRPNLVFEDISGSATDYQIFVDSNTMKFLYGDASTNTKLANEVLEINTTGIDVTGDIDISTSGASNTSKGLAIATSGTNFESDGGIISIDHAASGAVTGGYFSKYSAGGTLRHSIKGDGTGYFANRVGIGTASPNHEIHIESTSPSIRLVDTDGNNTLDIGQSGSACYIDFDNNVRFRNLANVERLRIDAGGIDVTGKIQLTSADPEIFLTDTTTNVDHSIDANSGVGNLFIHVDKNDEGSDPKFIVNVGSTGDLIVATETGYVGIGAPTPDNRLHIFDNNSDISMDSSASGQLHIDGNGYGFGIALNANAANIYTNTASRDLVFGVNETEVVRVTDDGTICTRYATTSQNQIDFVNPNGTVGRISTNGSATTYATSSDYRLKTDAQPMTGSIERVKALNPVNFEWIAGGTRVDGFLAHEAQSICPEAVTGTQDGMQDEAYVVSEATGDIYTPAVEATYETIQVELTPAVEAVYETVTVEISPAVEATYDEDGNELTPAIEAVTEEQEQLVTPAVDATYEEQQQELTPAIDEVIHSSDVEKPDELEEGQTWRETTEKVMATRQVPDYQGIDQSKLVPLLTSALQDAIAKIEALETRLTALEA